MILSFVSLVLNSFNTIGGVNVADVSIKSNFLINTNSFYVSGSTGTVYNFDGSIQYDCDVTKEENESDEYYVVNVKTIYFSIKNGNNVLHSSITDVSQSFEFRQFANGTTNVAFVFGNSSGTLLYQYKLNVFDDTYYTYNGATGLPLSYPRIGQDAIYNTFEFDFSSLENDLDNLWVANTNSTYSSGYHDGFNTGYYQGENIGYSNGYNDGFSEGMLVDETAFTIFNGILNIALVPINFFLAIFNFEILGINITEFITALLTLACTFIVIKLFMGSKGGE